MRMKSPKEDHEIMSDLGTREDLLNFFSFYTLVIYHVIIFRSYKCTSKVVTQDNKITMAENTISWSETAQDLKEDDSLKLKLHYFFNLH